MNNIKVKIAFATQDEFFCEPDEVRESFVLVVEFNTADYSNKQEFLAAIDVASERARTINNGYVHKVYLNVSECPSGSFFPTGGINWAETAWRYSELLNGQPKKAGIKQGDRVKHTTDGGEIIEKTVFGFDEKGDAILNWDCWWLAVPVEHLSIVE